MRGLAGSLGLEIIALQPFRDFESLPAPGEGLGALIIPHEVTWKIE